MSPEIRWVLDTIRARDSGPVPIPPWPLNWDRVLTGAEREGLAPALGFALRGAAPAGIPSAVRARLNRHVVEATARYLLLRRELGWLLVNVAQDGIPVIPLKGPALADALYPDPVLRPSSDLDLLVRPQTVPAVDALLQGLGYRRMADAHSWDFDLAFDRATLYAGPSGVHVDLHWSLLSDPRYVWNEAEEDGIWQRAARIAVAGEEALTLSAEDLLLYLAAHLAVHHGLSGLLWYWDLALLLGPWGDKLDWDAISTRAASWRVSAALWFAMRGCQEFFDVAPPDAVMSRLQPWGPRAATLRWLVREHDAARLKRLEHLIALLLVDRGRDVLASVTSALFPSPPWVRARYGRRSTSLAAQYVAHYQRMGAIARMAVSGTPGTKIPPP